MFCVFKIFCLKFHKSLPLQQYPTIPYFRRKARDTYFTGIIRLCRMRLRNETR